SDEWIRKNIDGNTKYNISKKSCIFDNFITQNTSNGDPFLIHDNPSSHIIPLSKRKRNTSAPLILPVQKSIIDIRSLQAYQFSQLLKHIFTSKKLEGHLLGVYISAVGTKSSCFSNNFPYVVVNMITQNLCTELFDFFIVDAAIQACTARHVADFGITLFSDPFLSTKKAKDGVCNLFGSKISQNQHSNRLKRDGKNHKIEMIEDGIFKVNNYSTLNSTICPRTLKLSKALQFSGIALFLSICDKVFERRPPVKYLDLLDGIKKIAIKNMNSNFGYRYEATIPFYNMTQWFETTSNKIMNSQNFKLYKTKDLIEQMCDYISDFKNIITNKNNSPEHLAICVIYEILTIQHVLQGVSNTHQLQSRELRYFLINSLTFGNFIPKINIPKIVNKFKRFVTTEMIDLTARKIVQKCKSLKKGSLTIIHYYEKILELKTAQDAANLFLVLYKDAIESEKNKIQKLADSSDFDGKEITINTFINLHLKKLKKIQKITKHTKPTLIIKLYNWLNPHNMVNFANELESVFFSNHSHPVLAIHDLKVPTSYYRLVKSTSLSCNHFKSEEEPYISDEIMNQPEIFLGLPFNVWTIASNGILSKKEVLIREDHTIEEKARIIAAYFIYKNDKNYTIKILSDIRFALIGLKTQVQIKEVIKSYKMTSKKLRTVTKKRQESFLLVKNLAENYKYIYDYEELEKFYQAKNIVLSNEEKTILQIGCDFFKNNKQKNNSENAKSDIHDTGSQSIKKHFSLDVEVESQNQTESVIQDIKITEQAQYDDGIEVESQNITESVIQDIKITEQAQYDDGIEVESQNITESVIQDIKITEQAQYDDGIEVESQNTTESVIRDIKITEQAQYDDGIEVESQNITESVIQDIKITEQAQYDDGIEVESQNITESVIQDIKITEQAQYDDVDPLFNMNTVKVTEKESQITQPIIINDQNDYPKDYDDFDVTSKILTSDNFLTSDTGFIATPTIQNSSQTKRKNAKKALSAEDLTISSPFMTMYLKRMQKYLTKDLPINFKNFNQKISGCSRPTLSETLKVIDFLLKEDLIRLEKDNQNTFTIESIFFITDKLQQITLKSLHKRK
ncbi:hypothetical protein M153_1410002, partial [Pseudoloma neurophilia]